MCLYVRIQMSYTTIFNENQLLMYIYIYIFLGPMSIQRTQSPLNEPRIKRMRRMSSAEDTEIDLGGQRDKSSSEITYYGQSPASLSSQTSWHSDIDHGTLFLSIFVYFFFNRKRINTNMQLILIHAYYYCTMYNSFPSHLCLTI